MISVDCLGCPRKSPVGEKKYPLLPEGPALCCAGCQLGLPTFGVRFCTELVGFLPVPLGLFHPQGYEGDGEA